MSKKKSSPSEYLSAEDSLLYLEAREDLVSFCILKNKNWRPNWHHEIIADQLMAIEKGDFQKQGKKILMLFLPPRHGKSEETTINFPAWYLGRNPEKEVLVCSYSGDLAELFGYKAKQLVDAPDYRLMFDTRLNIDQKSKTFWSLSNRSSYVGVGIGGAITGRGADILIIDDPIKNDEEANSEVYRNKIWDFFRTTAWTRLHPNAVVIIILTRWHLDDLAGRILKDPELADLVKIIKFPAIAIENEQYRPIGAALWPEKYPLSELEITKKVVGPYAFNALYQQNPVATENQEFKEIWFKKRPREEVERLNTRRFLTIDTAMSEKSSADYTGFCENYVDRENKWNFSAYRMKLNPKDFTDYLFTLQDKRNFEKIGIEKTTYTIGLKTFLDEEMRRRNRFLPIVELEHQQTQKEVRIRGLIPRYSSYSINHIEGECRDLEEELLNFPKAINDDVSDAAAYQLQIAEDNQVYYEEINIRNNRDSYGYRE